MSNVRDVSDANFEKNVLKNGKPVLVDFWATWCGPCRQVAPEMEKLADKYYDKVDVVRIDVDENPALATRYNVLSIPTVAFFPNSGNKKPVSAIGYRPAAQLEVLFHLVDYLD